LSEATAVAEEVAPQLESTPSTPVSEASSAPPSIEESVAPGTGTETPADEGGSEAPQRTPESYGLQELNDLYKDGKLSDPALVQRRESLTQSVQQRQEWERAQIAEAETRQRQHIEALTSEYAGKADFIREQLNAYASGQDRELTEERIARSLMELRDKSQQIAEAPLHYNLDRLALSPTFFGDSVQNRRSLAQQTVNEKIDALIRRSYELGRNAGPDAEHVVIPKKQLESDYVPQGKYKKDLDDLRSSLAGLAPPSGGGMSAGGGKYYSQMSPEERQGLSAGDRDRLVAVEAAARARGAI